MELTHRFTVPAPIDRVWTSFNDLGSLLACVPSLTLTSSGVFDFRGATVIVLGEESVSCNGSGSITERDEAGHRVVVEAAGQLGGAGADGTATATVRATLEGAGDSTVVEVRTDLNATGRAAALDPDLITDAADHLVDQLAGCLADRHRTDRREVDLGMVPPDHETHSELDAMGHGGPADSEPVGTGDGPAGGGAQSGGASGVTAASSGTANPPGHLTEAWTPPKAEPTELALATPIPGLARRYGPAAMVGLITVVPLVIRMIRRRR